jgi:hypothetical protein
MSLRDKGIKIALQIARQRPRLADGGILQKHEAPVSEPRQRYEGLVANRYADGGMIKVHPAMNIPGVHIRTAEAGEPFFYGDK